MQALLFSHPCQRLTAEQQVLKNLSYLHVEDRVITNPPD